MMDALNELNGVSDEQNFLFFPKIFDRTLGLRPKVSVRLAIALSRSI